MALILSGDTGPSFVQRAAMPAGSVIQVVQGSSTQGIFTNSATYVNVTGAGASITPTSTSNRILISITIPAFVEGANGGGFRLLRNGSVIYDPNGYDGTGPFNSLYSSGTNLGSVFKIEFIDSPATTSVCSYTIQYRQYLSSPGSSRVNFPNGGAAGTINTILTEIAG